MYKANTIDDDNTFETLFWGKCVKEYGVHDIIITDYFTDLLSRWNTLICNVPSGYSSSNLPAWQETLCKVLSFYHIDEVCFHLGFLSLS